MECAFGESGNVLFCFARVCFCLDEERDGDCGGPGVEKMGGGDVL